MCDVREVEMRAVELYDSPVFDYWRSGEETQERIAYLPGFIYIAHGFLKIRNLRAILLAQTIKIALSQRWGFQPLPDILRKNLARKNLTILSGSSCGSRGERCRVPRTDDAFGGELSEESLRGMKIRISDRLYIRNFSG